MIRKIIKIDQDKCNGCGACATACHEGAIDIIDGKAVLTREHYCDGFGDCLPACPMDAISFEEREAPAYDEAAVLTAKAAKEAMAAFAPKGQAPVHHGGCPGSMSRQLKPHIDNSSADGSARNASERTHTSAPLQSQLSQWPVQIKLAPTQAPYFDNANLLIAADCTAYAYANFHQEFIRNRITLIGCPKLDSVDYADKLTEIIARNNIKSVTIVRMEVPCCGGLENAAKRALQASGKFIPWQVVTISIDGNILDN